MSAGTGTGIPTRILVDTCVWVDNYLGFRLGHADAATLISRADELGISLLYAVTTAKDTYYMIGHVLKARVRHGGAELTSGDAVAIDEIAWACLANMEEIATAVGLDASDVWLAKKLKAVHGDFEDNVIIAAARRAQADYLVTNDATLLRDAPIAALSAADACALLTALAPQG